MSEQDQEIYKDFNLVVSERWQAEIAGIFLVDTGNPSQLLVSKKPDYIRMDIIYKSGFYYKSYKSYLHGMICVVYVSCILIFLASHPFSYRSPRRK